MAKSSRSFLPKKQEPETTPWLFANVAFQKRYPALYEILACGLVDGAPRKGGTLTLFAGDARLKATLSDKDTGMVLFLDLEASGDVLEEIEVKVAGGASAWKPSHKNGVKPVF